MNELKPVSNVPNDALGREVMNQVATRSMYTREADITPIPVTGVDLEDSQDEARRQAILIAVTNNTYPEPIAYGEYGPFDDPMLYEADPWFDKAAVSDGYIIPCYVHNGSPRGTTR